MASGKLLGNAAALVAASLFGAAVVATRVAVQEVPPLLLALLRFGQGGAILWAGLFIASRGLLKVERRDIAYLVLLGAVMFAVFPVSFNIGIRFTPASRGALMIATMPIWSALLARIGGRETLGGRQIAGIVVTLLGVGLVLSDKGLNFEGGAWALLGDALLLFTAFCGALYGVLAPRMIKRYSPLTVTTYAMIFGTLLLAPAAALEGLPGQGPAVSGQTVWLIVFLGVVCGAVGFLLWTLALGNLSPTQVAVYANLNPMVAVLLGVFLLSEQLTALFLAGLGMTALGVALVNWPRRARPARRAGSLSE